MLDNLTIFSKHFISGKPFALYNIDNPDWLPTLNLGYEKMDSGVKTMEHVQRHERAKVRDMKRNLQEMLQFIPIVAVQLIKEVVMKETKLIALEQIEIGMQYIKIESPDSEKPQCASLTEIKALEDELNSRNHALHSLTQQLSVHLLPFCEESFKSDDFTRFLYWITKHHNCEMYF